MRPIPSIPRILIHGLGIALALGAATAPARLRAAMSFDLPTAFEQAQHHDPQFQAALAERDANDASASQAGTAYYPDLRFDNSQLQTDVSTRRSLTFSQPLFSVDRYATYRQAEPRREFAESTYRARLTELAQRLLKATTALVRANQAAQLNRARTQALEKQASGARRMFELGEGTRTDLAEVEAKYAQSRAAQGSLDAEARNAARALAAITGEPVAAGGLIPRALPPSFVLAPLDTYLQRVDTENPQVLAARQNERISALDALRAKGSLLPTVSATWVRSQIDGVVLRNAGITVSIPLQAGSYYGARAAAAGAVKAEQQARDALERARLEATRLYDLADAGRTELAMRRQAVDAAQLSVDANTRSYALRARSIVDVLNSIQTLFETRHDYVVALTGLTENLLDLLLQSATAPAEALARAQACLFGESGESGEGGEGGERGQGEPARQGARQ